MRRGDLYRVALKVATLPDQGERAAPEFESVRAAAERSGRPLREVALSGQGDVST